MKMFARCLVALILTSVPLCGVAQQNYSYVSVDRVVKLRILPGKTKEFYQAFAYAPKIFDAYKEAGLITGYSIYTLPYLNMMVAADPESSWQVRSKGKTLKALAGDRIAYFGDHVEMSAGGEDFASTTNQSDVSSSWVAGGGIYVPLYQKKTKVMLDVGVQYHNGGTARYLRPGSIVDLPDSRVQINPLQSDTHVMLVHLGVKIGL